MCLYLAHGCNAIRVKSIQSLWRQQSIPTNAAVHSRRLTCNLAKNLHLLFSDNGIRQLNTLNSSPLSTALCYQPCPPLPSTEPVSSLSPSGKAWQLCSTMDVQLVPDMLSPFSHPRLLPPPHWPRPIQIIRPWAGWCSFFIPPMFPVPFAAITFAEFGAMPKNHCVWWSHSFTVYHEICWA